MNTVMKAGFAGALALAGVAAHASIASPSSGSSDAILFAEVVNSTGTVVASYAGDTGVSISSIASGTTGTYLSSDSNLAKLFAADAAGDTVEFAVLGAQYTGGTSTTNLGKAGVAQFVTTTSGNDTTSLAKDNTASLAGFANFMTTTVSAVNTNINDTSVTSIEGASAASAGVWDIATTTQLADPDYNSTDATANLYYVTAGTGGKSTTKVSYTVADTATLSAAGLAIASATSVTTPLPAAVWLLGSGLLGLTGVARRKLKV